MAPKHAEYEELIGKSWKIIGNIAALFGNRCVVFMEKTLKRDFQNGDGIILPHRAPVKSKCDGLKS